MPKSKRAKVVTLTKTAPKGRTGKSKLIEKIQSFLDEYKIIYLFSVDNMRTKLFQDLRNQFRDTSRFYMGKKTLVKLAFGKNPEESYMKNLYTLSKMLDEATGSEVGVLFTNASPKVLEKGIAKVEEAEYARGGFVATQTIVKQQGVLEGFPTSMFEHLRKLKLPVAINKGTIELISEHEVCKEGERLSPEQAEMLKLLDIKMAKFKVNLLCRYKNGEVKEL